MQFRIATLNIWNRMGGWEDRLATIRAGLQTLDPEIVALQEVVQLDDESRFDQASAIARDLGYHACRSLHPEAIHPMGNAVLSKWPIRRSMQFLLPRVGSDESRTLLFAEIEAPFALIPVFCTHLNWKLDEGHIREKQIRFITDTILELAPIESYPPILAGDLNAEPESDEIRFLRGLTSLGGKSVYFADTFGIAGNGSQGATFSRENPNAEILREPNRRIDYVFIRGPDEIGRGEPLEASLCFNQPYQGAYASDHFGVIATIGA